MNAYQFFLKHAGYSYDAATETPMQGRIRCARAMAKSEAAATRLGYSYEWEIDQEINSSEFSAETPPHQLWCCVMRNPEGQVVASLGGIDFLHHDNPWAEPYRRVVEAELALEAMHEVNLKCLAV